MPVRDAPISPLPPMPVTPRVVYVYGGSFDPPHAYHLWGPTFAGHFLAEDRAWCLYVPAARSPLKRSGPVAADHHRVAMLRAMIGRKGPMSVWTDEIDRAAWHAAHSHGPARPSYTIDTLKRLRRLLPARTRIHLLIGADQAVEFHKWKSARAIVRLAEPLVMPRAGLETPFALARAMREGDAGEFWTAREIGRWAMRIVPVGTLATSSTAIRKGLTGTDAARVTALVHLTAPVAKYIARHGLYSAG